MASRQRPKLEAYEAHQFAVLHELYEIDGQLEKRQISCFVGDDYTLIIHEGADQLLDEVRIRLGKANFDQLGPTYLLYVLLDAIVDEYQAHADRLEDTIERIEEAAVGGARERVHRTTPSRTQRREDERVQLQLYSIKQQVARLRRYALPLERVLNWLVEKHGRELLPTGTRKLFRDVHDHTLRIADQVRNIDDLAQAVLDLNRSEQAEDLNQIQKKLSGWAAIFAVPTVIAGIYGMNYRLFPHNDNSFGFWFAVLLMTTCAILLYLYFKNREWL
jgi:magnesium transporter